MAINGNFPNISPSLLLDFAKTEVLDPRITFTRASTAVYYNGITTTKAEENYILQSQDFTTTWTATNANVSANTSVAPDNTTTADRILFNGGSAACRVNQTLPANTNSNQVFSVFIKNDGVNYVQLSTDNANVFADFDLLNVTVGTTGTSATANITASANSYVRCAIAFATNAVSSVRIQGVDSNTAAHNSVLTNAANVIVWGAQVEQRSVNYPTAYTATTTQAITNYVPTLQTAPAGTARFDHNPTTGESLGLLIEEQRTNLCLQSQDIGTTWTNGATTEELNTIVAPDGTLTGDKLVEDATNSVHILNQLISTASNVTATASIYVKAAGRTNFILRIRDSANNANLVQGSFDLSSVTSTAANSGAGTGAVASITSVGNNWYRCIVTGNPNGTGSTEFNIRLQDGNAYQGDGYSGIFLWGAQLEAGSFPTSYIATGAATVTRNADAASMTGTNFSSWYKRNENSFYTEFSIPFDGNANRSGQSFGILSVSNSALGATFNGYGVRGLYNSSTTDRVQMTARQGSTILNVTVSTTGFLAANTYYKISMVWDSASLLFCNSSVVSSSVTNTVFSQDANIDTLNIGSQTTGGVNPYLLNGHIRKLSYYPKRLTNTEIQNLTAS